MILRIPLSKVRWNGVKPGDVVRAGVKLFLIVPDAEFYNIEETEGQEADRIAQELAQGEE